MACMPVYIGKSGDLIGCYRYLIHRQTTEYRATQLVSSIKHKLSHAILALALQDTSILDPLAKVILQKVILFFILVLKVEIGCLALDQISGSAMSLTICSLYWSVPKTSFASFPPMEKLGYWIQLCVFFHVRHRGSWDILKFVEIFWRIFCVFAVALGCQKLWSWTSWRNRWQPRDEY